MTSETKSTAPTFRSLLGWAAFGAGGYAIGKYAALSGVELWDRMGGDVAIALGVAAIYLLLGLLVGAMVLSRRFRRAAMTEADALDLEEQRPAYAGAVVSCLAFGIALGALALAGQAGPLSPLAGAVIFAAALVVGFWSYLRSFHLLDELDRTVALESMMATYVMLLGVTVTWAALAHLDLVTPFSMLGLLSLFWVLSLAGSVAAAHRRGMLDD